MPGDMDARAALPRFHRIKAGQRLSSASFSIDLRFLPGGLCETMQHHSRGEKSHHFTRVAKVRLKNISFEYA
jgi:hypothetical protein